MRVCRDPKDDAYLALCGAAGGSPHLRRFAEHLGSQRREGGTFACESRSMSDAVSGSTRMLFTALPISLPP
jgi:hypothetical protein